MSEMRRQDVGFRAPELSACHRNPEVHDDNVWVGLRRDRAPAAESDAGGAEAQDHQAPG